MVINFLDIKLEEIAIEDIEQLRELRNKYKSLLLNKEYITKESQVIWFNNLNRDNSLYYKIVFEENICGFIFLKNIDKIEKSAETGILIKDNYLGTSYPYKAAMALSYYFFEHMKFEKMISIVKNDNEKAILFDSNLGYHKVEEFSGFSKYVCNREDFYTLPKNLKILKKYFKIA